MWLADQWRDFSLLDAGHGMKLEQWGPYLLSRPEPQAMWAPQSPAAWEAAHAVYHRSHAGGGQWEYKEPLPDQWEITYANKLRFIVRPTGFKHTGLFPEQAVNWDFMGEKIRAAGGRVRVLNLFAYTGGATLACAAAGAEVVHVDAAKGIVQWAKENAAKSGLKEAPIRYIVDDCLKFVLREQRRGREYDAIVMDPPSYGRGPDGQMFKYEKDVYPLICECAKLLSSRPLFFLLNSYTAGFAPQVAANMLKCAPRAMWKRKTSAFPWAAIWCFLVAPPPGGRHEATHFIRGQSSARGRKALQYPRAGRHFRGYGSADLLQAVFEANLPQARRCISRACSSSGPPHRRRDGVCQNKQSGRALVASNAAKPDAKDVSFTL